MRILTILTRENRYKWKMWYINVTVQGFLNTCNLFHVLHMGTKVEKHWFWGFWVQSKSNTTFQPTKTIKYFYQLVSFIKLFQLLCLKIAKIMPCLQQYHWLFNQQSQSECSTQKWVGSHIVYICGPEEICFWMLLVFFCCFRLRGRELSWQSKH